MNISQIYISDSPSSDLPPYLKFASGTIDLAFPEAKHVIYDNDMLRDFIKLHHDSEVIAAYDKLLPYSYRADLGRYCLLHTMGGWYFDISIICMNAYQPPDNVHFLAFRDIQRHSLTSWSVMTAVLYSKPNNPALLMAIENIIRNCKEEYYGITPLCPTGPTVLGQSLARGGARRDFIYGDFLELTPSHAKKNTAFILPDGTILAWGKQSEGGDLTKLGASGTNNYNVFWKNRNIYIKPTPKNIGHVIPSPSRNSLYY